MNVASDWYEHRITDFTQGYIDKIDNNELPEGALKDCRNVISIQVGKLSSRNGQALLNDVELSTGKGVQGLATFYLGTKKYLLVAVDGSLYYCNPPSGEMTLLKSDLDADAPLMFVTALVDGKNQIMGFNGVDTPFKWDGVNAVEDMQDYRIVDREKADTLDDTVYTLKNKPVRPGSDKFFVYANNALLDYEEDYSLDAKEGVITFDDPRVNVVDDLLSDDAQTVCYPLNGLVECLHPFKPGEDVELYDKSGNLIYTFVDEETHEEGDGNYRADYGNGLLYVPTSFAAYDVKVTTPEVLTTGDHMFYKAIHPFKKDTVPVVKDKDGYVIEPDSVIYAAGIVYFSASQSWREPLTIDYTYEEVVGETMTTASAGDGAHRQYFASSAFKSGVEPTVYDKNGNVLTPDGRSFVNGYVVFLESQTSKEPLTVDYTSDKGIKVTAEAVSPVSHTCYVASHPFKTGVVPVVRDSFGNVLAPESIDYAGGLIQFAASKEAVEPLSVTYTWVNDSISGDLGTLMPLRVKYKWVDIIRVDYQYSNGVIDSSFRNPITWKGRIFAMGGDDYIYWSDITENGSEYEAWPPINYWGVNPGKGETDGCLLVLQNELYIFKNRSIHRFRGSSLDDYNLITIASGVGCAGARAACLDSDSEMIYFISEQGLYQFDGLTPRNISRNRIPILWDSLINTPALHQAVAKSWHGLVLFSLPTGKSETNDMVLVYDPAVGSFWIWDSMEIACYEEFSTTSGTKLYAGLTHSGYVVEQDVGNNDMGQNIDAWFELPEIDIGVADKMKKARYIYVEHGENQNTWAEVFATKDHGEPLQLVAKSADGPMRKYAIRPTISGKWRYMGLSFKHSQASKFEIRSIMMPYKVKPKSSVKGGV